MKRAKKKAKSMDITFNDLVVGLISQSLKVYFKKHKDDSTYISLSMPTTLKSIPKNPAEYVYSNKLSAITLYLNLHEDFNQACEDACKQTSFLK